MKAKVILIFLIGIFFNAFSQTSDKGYSFQGFAIDPDGKALGSTSITVQFTISPSVGTGGTYIETHTLVSDPFGVFHAIIGKGAKGTGSIEFKNLDYTRKGTIYKLKVEVKKTAGGLFTTISDADFNAVPYARKAENGVPVGTIVAFGGDKNNVPEGWLLCDGASISQTDFPQLYAAIGSAWGTSGSSFNVPDLRGMFLRGVNDAKSGGFSDQNNSTRVASNTGGNSGNAVGTLQDDQNLAHGHSASSSTDGAHTHSYSTNDQASTDGDGASAWNLTDGEGANQTFTIPSAGAHSHTITIGSSGGNESRPINASVYYIIKY